MDKEIRFAVVMYGGVSLAIYINGVAQELLRMSKASNLPKDKYRTSTEKVYRIISYLLSNEDLKYDISDLVKNYLAAMKEVKDKQEMIEEWKVLETKLEKLVEKAGGTETKFIVDILSGTSAGGINSIYLGKALANNQEIDGLKSLWINEGDIATLLNDKKSVKGTSLSRPDNPRSLLNTRRLYLKLLEAFNGMGEDIRGKSDHLDELDLFVTTTDFHGVVAPIRLHDKLVYEKRFRQVFNFRYDFNNNINDFEKKHNPMMAFASRCTSAFPFAFEPMNLCEAESVLKDSFDNNKELIDVLRSDITKHLPNIVDKNFNKIDWLKRDFVDGGVLDNKPFSYVVDVLSARRSDYKGKRKLLYIEPSPEQFDRNKEDKTPNALQNAKAAVLDLPSYETIREDLERLLLRNRIVGRVERLITNAEEDVYEHINEGNSSFENHYLTELSVFGKTQDWEKKGLNDLVELRGVCVLPYYRLRVSILSDEIARIVARKNGIDEKSEFFAALRVLVLAWRKNNFKKNSVKEDTKEKDVNLSLDKKEEQIVTNTVLMFLKKYDLDYRLRRIKFVLRKSEELLKFDEDLREKLENRSIDLKNYRVRQKIKTKGTKNEFDRKLPTEILWEELGKDWDNNSKEQELGTLTEFQTEIKRIQTAFEKDLTLIQKEKEKNSFFDKSISNAELSESQAKKKEKSNDKESKEGAEIEKLPDASLDKLLEMRDSKNPKVENAKKSMDEKVETEQDKFNGELEAIKDENKVVYEQIEKTISELETDISCVLEELRKTKGNVFKKRIDEDLVGGIQGYLRHYFVNFDHYDQISFPIYYQSEVGEASEIDILRISPQDATNLVDEIDLGKPKLAGEKLFHFGAMLDPVWRQNDIMWGRLDGAERLITALLPDIEYEDLRKNLTKMAHLEILQDEILDSEQDNVSDVLTDSLVNKSAGLTVTDAVKKATSNMDEEVYKKSISSLIKSSLQINKLYDFFIKNYNYDESLEPKSLLQTISRSTKITGDVLDGVAEEFNQSGSKVRWIARLGQIFWGLIEIAAPNSLLNKMLTQWLMLLYFFEVLIIVGSTLLGKSEIQQFGVITLILTLIVHLSSVALNDYMRGGKIVYLLKFMAGGVLSVLIIAGAVFIYTVFYDFSLLEQIVAKQKSLVGYQVWQRMLPISLIVVLFASAIAWREARNFNIRAYGLLTIGYSVITVVIGIIFTWMISDIEYYISPILALEFIRSGELVTCIFGAVGSVERYWMKYVLIIDSFVFVPIYTAFLLYFTRLIRFRRSYWTIIDSNWHQEKLAQNKQNKSKKAKVIDKNDPEDVFAKLRTAFLNLSFLNLTMVVISVLILITGLADLSENYFSYWLLATSEVDTKTWMLNSVYYSAMLKWFLLSIITVFLSLVFWRGTYWKILSVLFVLLGGFGFWCLFFDIEIMNIFMILQIVMALVSGVLLLIFHNKFKRAEKS